MVARGGTRKLEFLRARPYATLTRCSGWDCITVEGDDELFGPDDSVPGFRAGPDQPATRLLPTWAK